MAKTIALPRPASGSRIGRFVAAGHLQWAAWIFGLAFALRGVWILYVDPSPWSDSFFYFWNAHNLATGEGYRNLFNPEEYTAAFPPGYPLALAALFAVFGSSVAVAKLFNVVLGALTAVLVYALATKLRDQRTGIVAGVLMALFPSQIFFTTTLMTETLFVALAALLVLLLTVWLAEQGSMKGWQVFALGLLLGFMALVRTETLLLAPALVVLWKLCGQDWRQVGRYLLLVVAGMAIFIAPWTARNYIRVDEFILIRSGSDQGIGRLIRRGLSPDYDDVVKYRRNREDPASFGELFDYYRSYPSEVAFLVKNKFADFFGTDDPFHWIRDLYGSPALSPDATSRWSALANAYYYVVGAGALLGALFWRSWRDKRFLILAWFIASWSLIHVSFVPSVRYHFAVLPMVSVLAAVAFMVAWDRLGSGSTTDNPRS